MQTNLSSDTGAKTSFPGARWVGSTAVGDWRAGDGTSGETGRADNDPALQRLFNELAYGLIVIDADRQVTHINRAARALLARAQCLRVTGRALAAGFERDAIPFSSALNKAFQGKRAILKIGASAGSFLLVPLPAPASANGALPGGIRHVALVFERSSCAESLAVAFYAQSHGLTNCEEQVLRALSGNQSIAEAAKAIGSAASTIRTHLNHIREKTGSSSLRALVASVKSMPPLMPAFGE